MHDDFTTGALQLITKILSYHPTDDSQSDTAEKPNKSVSGQLANLRRGIDETTEAYAIPYVYPYLPQGASLQQQKVLLRTAALCATFVKIPQYTQENVQDTKPEDAQIKPNKNRTKYFGHWCYEVSLALAKKSGKERINLENPDRVANCLADLHWQDFEEAVRSIYRLMDYASSLDSPPALNYYQLFQMLSRWGNGVSEASRAVRTLPLRDYYSRTAGSTVQDNPISTVTSH